MKLLIDQNISHRIIAFIQNYYPEAVHVREADLKDANDAQIFRYAREHGFEAIITHDDDFSKLLQTFNAPPKVIQFRTGNAKTKFLAELLINQQGAIRTFLDSEEADYFEIFAV
ncbi:MAG: DUF5615 family PIN-like protein [Saprospiraceae bacterium]